MWLLGMTDSAAVVLALVLPGWTFDGLAGLRFDKGDFPDAPPPRFQ